MRRSGRYKVFVRTWWKSNPSYPNGLEPHAGREHTIAYAESEEEARRIAQGYNFTHNPGKLSKKAEYTSQ